ncbi:DUF4389 domain-containing protein [Simiduia curdlanivorans]|uniref:DUF4389 domain-containing protein n=1 Tax=Simiduia curdlanivorans TaxID=1492769 RepID=A0ABV8V5I2_9GAMM|nr:DUF4389 domain-containing protein [Simiduia curdlanivorans]MDN3640672.1 DUF4389 domain-containing protein [Simiduia curdlanivorans]
MNQSTISQEQVIENLSNKRNWVRLVYMLIYGLALHIAGIIMWLLCTVQFVITMIFGQDNENLRKMAASISDYIHEALAFVSYNSEEKPFPFAKDDSKNTGEGANKDEPQETPAHEAQENNTAKVKDEPVTIDVEAQAVEDGPTDLPDEPKSEK